MELTGKRIAVIGLGKTGRATVEFLVRQGAQVVATDEKIPTLDVSDLSGAEIMPYEEGLLKGVEMVVPSPGVPPHSFLLLSAREKGLPILSELELAFRFLRVPLIAVTGTNGKTTTVTLIGHILSQAGKRVFVGGNIGTPLISYVSGPQEDDFALVEVSSFQLLWTEKFSPYVGILLNVTQDHLDYHGSMSSYRAAKETMFLRQKDGDYGILNGEERENIKLKERMTSQVITFSSQKKLSPPSLYLERGSIVYRLPEDWEEKYPISMVKIPGLHNIENCMAAIACSRILGCLPHDIVQAVSTFTGVAHRIESFAQINGVKYVDDSKGTNCDAVKRALETFPPPVILLMGGRDKDSDFSVLGPIVSQKVKCLIAFGEARESIARALCKKVEVIMTPTLKEGVRVAKSRAQTGDVVLLSPGCASFDEFRDYRERGIMFRKWVQEEGNDKVA